MSLLVGHSKVKRVSFSWLEKSFQLVGWCGSTPGSLRCLSYLASASEPLKRHHWLSASAG